MKYRFLVLFVTCFVSFAIQAQIGYQVSLLNSATGEPRANETVEVAVEITNSENAIICSETKSATTDDFGVLSLQVGTENTFKNVDWSKLPLYVSATVDGIMVGKSQILNVPVAEAAKTLVNVAPELICKNWNVAYRCKMGDCSSLSLTFGNNNIFSCTLIDYPMGGYDENGAYIHPTPDTYNCSGNYFIQGELICLYNISGEGFYMPTLLMFKEGKIHGTFGIPGYVTLQ